MTAPRSRRALAAFVVCAACAGCYDGPPAIRIFIDVEPDVPGQIDEVHVAISAASTEQHVCEAPTGLFNVTSSDALPLFIRVEQGEDYSFGVMYWISGWRENELVLEELRGWTEWPAEGERDLELSLSADCLIESLEARCIEDPECENPRCDAIHHCEAGECRADHWVFPYLRAHPELVDVGVSCLDEP
jgi:hypothetical protein